MIPVPRAAPFPVVVLLALLGWALPACAEEVFVLENGSVLRGNAVRETPDGLVIRLSGFADDARVTVATSRIVRRYAGTQGIPPGSGGRPEARPTDLVARPADDLPRFEGRPWTPGPTVSGPVEEPSVQREGFFERLQRVVLMAMPRDPDSRSLLVLLLFGALIALVLLGSRLLEIEGASLATSALLASAFGTLLLAFVVYSETLLRADRALWVMPAASASWMALAWGVLRCGFAKVVLLLAFQVFSLGIVAFTAGAVLVAF